MLFLTQLKIINTYFLLTSLALPSYMLSFLWPIHHPYYFFRSQTLIPLIILLYFCMTCSQNHLYTQRIYQQKQKKDKININKQLMVRNTRTQAKSLGHIIWYIPNILTASRILLIYVAAILIPSYPQTAGLILIISVVFDYFDGMAARRYRQCSLFGDMFDWFTDILCLAIVLFWWNQLEPHLIILIFSLLLLELMTMIVDISSKSRGFLPKLKANSWATVILRYTMYIQKKGYSSKGIGYWNQIIYFACMLSRVLYVITKNSDYNYLFVLCIPMSVSYVWMHFAYTLNILQKWNQEYQDNEIKLKFVDQ